jgi:hypothetical protein
MVIERGAQRRTGERRGMIAGKASKIRPVARRAALNGG